jgi:hypothetical protein
MESYKYNPLKAEIPETRVLSLLPGDFGSPINVLLSTITLSESSKSSPEALSYAWGPVGERVDITVKGPQDRTLSITANLAEALRYLRYTTAPRLLWIDAICINQQDLEERSRQVRWMTKIYSSAQRVIIWVGTKSGESDLALDCISKIVARVRIDPHTTQLYSITAETHWTDHNAPLPLSGEEQAAMSQFYSRSWFRRLWVWQEVHLAREAMLLCGFRYVPWEAVRLGVMYLGLRPHPETVEWLAPEAAFNLCGFGTSKNDPLSLLLHQTRDSDCSDPRDRIYALLSFLSRELQARIIPDYTKSVEEVYKDVMLEHFGMNDFDGPGLLTTIELLGGIPRNPSWVPRWEVPRLATRFYHIKAAVETRPCVMDHSTTSIGILGVQFAEIAEVESINLSNDVDQDRMLVELRRLKECFLPASGKNNSPKGLSTLLATLTTNYLAERHHPPYGWRPSMADFQSFSDHVFETTELADPRFGPLFRNIREFGSGRTLCSTIDGGFCLGPVGVRSGDILTVFLGCDSPMVLRPVASDLQGHHVVGQAYCHGFMDGEALLGQFPEHWRLVIRHDWPISRAQTSFFNSETGTFSPIDPRLGELSKGWSTISHDDEEFQTLFMYDSDGERFETWDDPRVSLKALRERGVPLKTFTLI